MNMDNVIIISMILGAAIGWLLGYGAGQEKGYIEGAADTYKAKR